MISPTAFLVIVYSSSPKLGTESGVNTGISVAAASDCCIFPNLMVTPKLIPKQKQTLRKLNAND
jgi:hypothetical protein